jgi:uncharacterized protein involved in response to NO
MFMAAREIAAGRNWRNLALAIVLALALSANILFGLSLE